MQYTYTILTPSGNTTALVDFDGRQLNNSQRKEINDRLMSKHPEVEQVGFVHSTYEEVSLQMAGDEFCINASRAAAYLHHLRSKQNTCKMSVSGYPGVVYGEVQESLVSVKLSWPPPTIRTIDGYQIVDLPGITHVIVDASEKPTDSILLKKNAQTLMQRLNLQSQYPALGIMYVYEKQLQKYLFPVVYVRDIDTLIYETACGSGTIAASAVQMKRENMREWTREYIQPSNISLCASLRETETQLEVSISGCIDPRCLTGVIDTKV